MKISKINIYMIIAILEIAIGLYVLIWATIGYHRFFSYEEAEHFLHGLVSFAYYKEHLYRYFFVGAITLFSGISYIFNKKIHWVLTHSLIILLFFSLWVWSLFEVPIDMIFFDLIVFNTPTTMTSIAIFTLLEIFQIKNLKKREYSDNKKTIIISSILGILFSTIAFLLMYFV